MARLVTRRSLIGTSLATIPAVAFAGRRGNQVVAQSGTPVPGTPVAATPIPVAQMPAVGAGHLVVADNGAAVLHVFDLVSLELVATLPDITINDHAGFLPLPDSRVLAIDSGTGELITLQLDAANGPEITSRVAVPATVSHFAVDPGLRYVVVGASDETQPLTIVELTTGETYGLAVEAGEAGVMLGGDPLMLFHRNDVTAEFESYSVDGIIAGDTAPVATVPTGVFGHGEAISHQLGKICTATDDGLDIAAFADGDLTYDMTLPWDTAERTGGRGYFARLSADGQTLFSYMADRPEDRPWGEWQNDVYIADLSTGEVSRLPLAPGYVFRFGLGDTSAVFHNLHPDGDNAYVLDTDRASDTFGQVTATIPLAPLTNAPSAKQMPWEAEGRVSMVTPDGGLGFVSHGGDGLISIIDPVAGTVIGQLTTPTALAGGGYLVAVQPGMPLADTIAR